MLHEGEGGDWGDASTNQRMTKFASKSAEMRGKKWSRFFLTDLREKQLCWHIDFGLLMPELWDKKFLLFEPPSVWHFGKAAPEN